MHPIGACARWVLRGALAAGAVVAAAGFGHAGGFAVREQSVSSQGASFAGSAAGYDLSSTFWNPAAFGIAGWGITSESHYALIIPDASLTGSIGFPPTSTDIGLLAFVPASYAAYRLNRDLVLGLSINAPFGLTTKPEDIHWQGSFVGQTAKVFTANISPSASYQVAPGLFVGAGIQFEYMKLTYRFADSPATTASAELDDNWAVGLSAGILWQPSKATSIGLGFRSSITHDLDGSIVLPAFAVNRAISTKFETPEIVTLSIRQAIAPHLRALGTIEWSNWSRFGALPIENSLGLGPGGGSASLDGNWHDGWLYAAGLEYDVSGKLTVRGGFAFEKSPIQNATERLIQVPDSDRWWVSGGLTYKWSEKMAFDFAYSHIFFDDAPFLRQNLNQTVTITGTADQSADIVSGSLKIKW
jgi:long-chain fatty acid transport protein